MNFGLGLHPSEVACANSDSPAFVFCTSPLGIKVIGGIKELTGEEYGVYVKRILPGGVAYADGE